MRVLTLLALALLAVSAIAVFLPAADAKCVGTTRAGACESTDLPGQANACGYANTGKAATSACVVMDWNRCGGGIDAQLGAKTIGIFHLPCPGPVIG